MGNTRTRRAIWRMLFVLAIAPAFSLLSGCQVEYAGQTLPSPYYLTDDIQYYAPGPEFKLSNEAAAMKAREAEAALQGAAAPKPGYTQPKWR